MLPSRTLRLCCMPACVYVCGCFSLHSIPAISSVLVFDVFNANFPNSHGSHFEHMGLEMWLKTWCFIPKGKKWNLWNAKYLFDVYLAVQSRLSQAECSQWLLCECVCERDFLCMLCACWMLFCSNPWLIKEFDYCQAAASNMTNPASLTRTGSFPPVLWWLAASVEWCVVLITY